MVACNFILNINFNENVGVVHSVINSSYYWQGSVATPINIISVLCSKKRLLYYEMGDITYVGVQTGCQELINGTQHYSRCICADKDFCNNSSCLTVSLTGLIILVCSITLF